MDISSAELARQLQVPANRINQIINGRRSITGDTAIRLGHWFGMSPEFWLNLQSTYELRRAMEKTGAQIAKLPTRAA